MDYYDDAFYDDEQTKLLRVWNNKWLKAKFSFWGGVSL